MSVADTAEKDVEGSGGNRGDAPITPRPDFPVVPGAEWCRCGWSGRVHLPQAACPIPPAEGDA